MDGHRLLSLLDDLNDLGAEDEHEDGPPVLVRLCRFCLEILPVSGAGMMLIASGEHQGVVCATSPQAFVIEEAQSRSGEGPCLDAYHRGEPVTAADLELDGRKRWPLFAPAALGAGIRAVFSWPLKVGSVAVGALDLYREQPGELSPEQLADAQVVADVATHALLSVQATAPGGSVASELQAAGRRRALIEQAKGMTAAQLGVGLGDALRRLREAARGDGRALADIAGDVVAGRLRVS